MTASFMGDCNRLEEGAARQPLDITAKRQTMLYERHRLVMDAILIGTVEDGFDRLVEEIKSVVEVLDEASYPVAALTAEQSVERDIRLLDLLYERQKIRDLKARVAQLGRTPSEEDGA